MSVLAELNAELAPVRPQLEVSAGGLLVDMEPVAPRWRDRAAAELARWCDSRSYGNRIRVRRHRARVR